MRASVFKAYIGAYWRQCIDESDSHDDGSAQGPYPNPVTAMRFWLDDLIQHELLQLREVDDLSERTGNVSLGGSLALLNERAAQRRPPILLEWEESEEGSPHKRTFHAEVKGRPHPRYQLLRIETNSLEM